MLAAGVSAQHFQISSPDDRIQMEVRNEKTLSYSVVYKDKVLVADSPLGFEFKDEKPMQGNFALLNVPQAEARSESWIPVVKNKHEKVQLHWNEMTSSRKNTFLSNEEQKTCRLLENQLCTISSLA